jgi:AbrB family looped-hinge helix DNA binding protein
VVSTAILKNRGRITLPSAVRERLQLAPGDQVDFAVNEFGEVVLRRATYPVADLRGLLKRPRKSLVTVEKMNQAIARHHSAKR